jgi:integrase/recombinase XerC/integrase/recombinase XerD
MRSDKPILTLVNEFLANHDVAENSRKLYRANLYVFIGWLTRNGDVRSPKRSDIIGYKNWLMASGKSAMTIDNYLVVVRLFFRWLEEENIYDNIAAGVHHPKKYLGYRKGYLKPLEVNSLLGLIDRDTIQGKRDYAIINLMVRTGLRCIEVSRSDVQDLTKENDHWVISIQSKGHHSKDRPLGISEKAVAPIRDYLNQCDDVVELSPMFRNHSYVSNNTRLTPLSISKIVKKYMRAIGIDSSKLSAHSLRHTAAITALRSGATMSEVQHMLGHRSPDTTMIYLRAIEDELRREGTAVSRLDNAYEIPLKSEKIKQNSILKDLHGK